MTDNAKEIQSPCIRNCCLDQDDICLGCFRSVSEIVAWGPANDEERKLILLNSNKRKKLKNSKSDSL
jgi:uncharacterized protein